MLRPLPDLLLAPEATPLCGCSRGKEVPKRKVEHDDAKVSANTLSLLHQPAALTRKILENSGASEKEPCWRHGLIVCFLSRREKRLLEATKVGERRAVAQNKRWRKWQMCAAYTLYLTDQCDREAVGSGKHVGHRGLELTASPRCSASLFAHISNSDIDKPTDVSTA